MVIERLQRDFGWPTAEEIWRPSNPGSRICAELANRKVGDALRRLEGSEQIRLGVLSAESSAGSSVQPIAIVCEFARMASAEALREAHRLAWNFARVPLLITLEPHLVRAWTCCEPPESAETLQAPAAEIPEARCDLQAKRSLTERIEGSLHWLELATGRFFEVHAARFPRSGCADRLLLENLKHVRHRLRRQKLSDDTSHDLLGRLIFIQFLFDRRDSSGVAALSVRKLRALQQQGVLKNAHMDLDSLLRDYNDCYAMFRWLNTIFHGDLFPGKGQTERAREAEWRQEMREVQPDHLQTLADFVGGRMAMRSAQRLLWKHYSFDAIPLDFISSIYEEFVTKAHKGKCGAVYTPSHLVDFVLDEVLPWNSDDWDVRILDPACGSGIFLVKSFQRLIHRWRTAHRGQVPKPSDLRDILTNNLVGVDIDPHAVRVASFSLYLAMCDEIDPRYYWTHVRFPRLRDQTLICSDFFSEQTSGISSTLDPQTFDIMVGNAPWGRNTLAESDVDRWAECGWSPVYKSIGPLFLAKGLTMLRAGGRLSMLQPAGIILNPVGTAEAFRKTLFAKATVEAITNLAALRFSLFPNATGPACIITLCNQLPDGSDIVYVCPKATLSVEDGYRILVEPYDMHMVSCDEATANSLVWTALMWGGRRDLKLIGRLLGAQTLGRLGKRLKSREGIIRGNQKRTQLDILGRRIIEQPRFPTGTWLRLRAAELPVNENPFTDAAASTDFAAFELPQLIIKQSWSIDAGRFEAAIVESNARTGGVLCTQSYVSVHLPRPYRNMLEVACLVCNSAVAVYFMFLASARLASYRPEPLVGDWLRLPLPDSFDGIDDAEPENPMALDQKVFGLLELNGAERILVEDMVNITLADFKGSHSSIGRRRTGGEGSGGLGRDEGILMDYCEQFIAVIKAAFGQNKQVRATIFCGDAEEPLAVRLVAFQLNCSAGPAIELQPMESRRLIQQLRRLGQEVAGGGGEWCSRVARIYDPARTEGRVVPTVYLVKPDRVRYWTRSIAFRDADEVVGDFMLAEGMGTERQLA